MLMCGSCPNGFYYTGPRWHCGMLRFHIPRIFLMISEDRTTEELEVGAEKITILLTSEYFLNCILKLTWNDFWILNTSVISQFTKLHCQEERHTMTKWKSGDFCHQYMLKLCCANVTLQLIYPLLLKSTSQCYCVKNPGAKTEIMQGKFLFLK